MKTAEEIAIAHCTMMEDKIYTDVQRVVNAMKYYAAIVATDTRKRCAKQATVKHIGTVAGVDKQSILDVEILTP